MITERKRPANGLMSETDHYSSLTIGRINPNIIENNIFGLSKDERGG